MIRAHSALTLGRLSPRPSATFRHFALGMFSFCCRENWVHVLNMAWARNIEQAVGNLKNSYGWLVFPFHLAQILTYSLSCLILSSLNGFSNCIHLTLYYQSSLIIKVMIGGALVCIVASLQKVWFWNVNVSMCRCLSLPQSCYKLVTRPGVPCLHGSLWPLVELGDRKWMDGWKLSKTKLN